MGHGCPRLPAGRRGQLMFRKAWVRWLAASLLAGALVLWLGLNGGIRYGGFGWFR